MSDQQGPPQFQDRPAQASGYGTPGGDGHASSAPQNPPPGPPHGYSPQQGPHQPQGAQPPAPQPGTPQPGAPHPGGQQFGTNYGTHAQPGYPVAQPGLLDTTFATSTTQQTAKLAYVAIIIFSAVLALVGLFGLISDFAAIEYSGITVVLRGLGKLLLYGGLAFVMLTVGRLVVDYFVQEDRRRS